MKIQMKKDKKIKVITDQNGAVKSFNIKGMLHNTSGPAVISPDGSEEWFLDGIRHRGDGGPAVKRWNGDRKGFAYFWYMHSQLHRIGGPAIIEDMWHGESSREWFENNKRHRIEVDEWGAVLPAVEKKVKGKCILREWWVNGAIHRDNDLPAVERTDNIDGVRQWWKNGNCHREVRDENGLVLPAIEKTDGTREWWVNGNCHRDDRDENGLVLPAIEKRDGTREWFNNGKRHRDDRDESGLILPAVEQPALKIKEWWRNGKLHRDGGLPAIEYDDGSEWWVDGVRHRLDGPAISDGVVGFWYLNGKEVKKEEHPFWRAKQEEQLLEKELDEFTEKTMTVRGIKNRM